LVTASNAVGRLRYSSARAIDDGADHETDRSQRDAEQDRMGEEDTNGQAEDDADDARPTRPGVGVVRSSGPGGV